jgi:hypothetical protein
MVRRAKEFADAGRGVCLPPGRREPHSLRHAAQQGGPASYERFTGPSRLVYLSTDAVGALWW